MTNKQKQALQLLIHHPEYTDTKICEICNGTNAWLCKLKQQPEFQQAIKDGIADIWKGYEAIAVANMLDLANNGNDTTKFNANKYILDNLGYNSEQKLKIDSNIIKVSIEDD